MVVVTYKYIMSSNSAFSQIIAKTETPGGLINGVNTVYTTTQTIGTVIVLAFNGQFIAPSEYTVSGAGFTMGVALPNFPSGSFTISYI